MKWLILAGFIVVCLPDSEGGALRCDPSVQPCGTGESDLLPPTNSKLDMPTTQTEHKRNFLECAPGTSWKSDCNDCWCLPAGVTVCTRVECQSGKPDVHCAPESTWGDECHSCRCTAEGKAVCTDVCSSIKKNFLECAPGTTWMSDCNSCRCLQSGLPSCTRMECPLNKPFVKCAPESTWGDDCHSCRCSAEGRSVCTDTCSSINSDNKSTGISVKSKATLSRKVRAFAQEGRKACQPGQEFRMDCNNCLCDSEGMNFSCTRFDCNNNNQASGVRSKRETTEQISMTCVPESVFNRDCNVCRCRSDGETAVCTNKKCKQLPADDEAHTEPELGSGFRCNPGEQFRRECKDCTCSADGKSVFCTIRLCDQDTTPDI